MSPLNIAIKFLTQYMDCEFQLVLLKWTAIENFPTEQWDFQLPAETFHFDSNSVPIIKVYQQKR